MAPVHALTALIFPFGGVLVGQIPAHAVALDPTVGFFEAPQVVRSGESVHAVGWQPTSAGIRTIYYSRSDDGGRTWPVRESMISVANQRGLISLAADGDDVHIGFDPGNWMPHVVSSRDRGNTWQPPAAIGGQGFGTTAPTPTVRAFGARVNALWFAEVGGLGRVLWSARSLDRGVTWGQPQRIDGGAPSAWAIDQRDEDLRVLGDGAALHVVWRRGIRTGTSQWTYHTLHQRSLDGGVTWLAAPTVVASTTIEGLEEPPQPAAVGGGAVLVASGSQVLRSLDQGNTWQAVAWPGLLSGAWRVYDLAADGANVLAIGRSNAGNTLLVNASGDAGTTWRHTPYAIAVPTLTPTPFRAHVGGSALLVTVEFRQFPWTVIQSDDGANSWRIAGQGTVLAADADGAFLASIAASDWWIWPHGGHSVHGVGTAGSGNVVPRLAGRGFAGIGRQFDLAVTLARPTSPVAWFASPGPLTAVPVGSATRYLTQPVALASSLTSSAGEAALSLTVPANPALAGLRIASQAFVFDPAVAAGFTATRAVETWIY